MLIYDAVDLKVRVVGDFIYVKKQATAVAEEEEHGPGEDGKPVGQCHDVESAAWDAPAYLDGGAYVGPVFCVGEPDDVVDLKV